MPALPGAELPTLAAGQLLLRHLTGADAPALFDVFSDPEVTRYWSRPPMEDPAEADALVAEIHAFARAGTLLQWGIARAARPDEVIGTCTLAAIDQRHRRAEIGFAVARAAWGRGVAGSAAGRVVRFGFEALELHRIAADVDPRNVASARVLRRLGFRLEGHLREHYWQSGEWQHADLYGLLRREWSGAAAPAARNPPASDL